MKLITLWRPLLASLLIALLGALAACGGDEPTPEASATIGPAGGTLNGPDGVQLVVPPGALASATTLRIARTGEGAPELPGDIRADSLVYEITPHELQFAVPVQVRLPVDGNPGADTVVLAASRGGDWSSQTARFEGTVAVIERTSLSWYQVGNWGANVSCAIPRDNTDPYPCQPTRMLPGTLSTAPASALSNDGKRITAAASLTVPVTFVAKRDCGSGRLVVQRSAWGPGRTSTGPATVYDQPLALAPATASTVRGSASVVVHVGAADNGYMGLQFSFSCTRAYRGLRASAGGFLSLEVDVPVPAPIPKIVQAPADISVPAGATADFTVLASAPQGLSVQWQRSNDGGASWADVGAGTAITDGSRYTLTTTLADDGARFRARVCNGSGATQSCLDSSAARLTVTPVIVPAAPTITRQPSNQTWAAGSTITFDVGASGTPAPTVAWAVNGTALPASGSYTQGTCSFNHASAGSTLTLTAATADCIGASFVATARNASGSVLSNAAQLVAGSVNAVLLAGSAGVAGSTDGAGTAARFNTPNYLTQARDGRIAIGDFSNSTIRLVATNGDVSTLAGSPGGFGFADGTGSAARFNGNGGVAFDSAGNLFVSDWDNHVIRRITPAGVVSTFAGTAGAAGSTDGTGAAARFSNPNGLAIDAADNVYVVDWGNHTLRKITPAGVVSTLAGSPGVPGSADGTGAAARFSTPGAVAVDAAGNLYVTDMFNHAIRKVTPAGNVSTLAGTLGLSGTVDAVGSAARFEQPAWIASTADGTLFVVSATGDTVRRVSSSGAVSTVVGVAGDNATLRLGSNPRLRNARGVWAVSSTELLIAADQTLIRVRLP